MFGYESDKTRSFRHEKTCPVMSCHAKQNLSFISEKTRLYWLTVAAILDACTSTSQRAFELVADVAVVRPVVRKNTRCFFLYSSPVRNFSCSAWNSRTTSPCTAIHRIFWSSLSPTVNIFSLLFSLVSDLLCPVIINCYHISYHIASIFYCFFLYCV